MHVSSKSPCPPIRLALTNGSSSSPRRASVVCESNRAQRRAASKSNAATSEAELQLRIDLASSLLERRREVVLERDRRQRKLDQIRIGLDARPPLGLLEQFGANPTADPPALLAQKTGLFRRLHDRLEPRLADEKLTVLRITLNDLGSPRAAFEQGARPLSSAYCWLVR